MLLMYLSFHCLQTITVPLYSTGKSFLQTPTDEYVEYEKKMPADIAKTVSYALQAGCSVSITGDL